jgi:hypothetical protein
MARLLHLMQAELVELKLLLHAFCFSLQQLRLRVSPMHHHLMWSNFELCLLQSHFEFEAKDEHEVEVEVDYHEARSEYEAVEQATQIHHSLELESIQMHLMPRLMLLRLKAMQ